MRAVVVARAGADVGGCLDALAAAGVDAPLVVRDDGRGLASARNEALARCSDEVLALVEDDVRVAPGWLDALLAGWADGDERLGCVGGPLRAGFPDGRPAWLTDPLLGGFALHDRPGTAPGPAPVAEGTFHGGNVSFRAVALRGIGGFWPARGHSVGRDCFSDEHHAQRELAAAGWTAAWAPDAAAERVVPADVTPGQLVRRRARYGARDTLIGARRPAAGAARTALTSAAGTALALAHPARGTTVVEPRSSSAHGSTGVNGLAVERAARTAENLGALAAPLLAHADLQPSVRSTPFRHTLPRPAPSPLQAARRRAGARLRRSGGADATTILLYHRIATPEHDPLGLAVGPAHFAAHLAVLGDRVISLAEAAAGRPGVAITFDDGYVDNLAVAAPLLEDAAAPATLFLSTGHVETGQAFWWDTLDRALRAAPPDAGPLRLHERAWPAGTEEERAAAFTHAHRWLQGRPPHEQDAATQQLAAWAGMDPSPPATDRPVTREELPELGRAFDLQAHTRTHRSLGQATPHEQREELARSLDDLGLWVGHHPTAISYPYGVPGTDVTRATLDQAREVGYTVGVVNAPAAITDATDRLALPRHVPPNAGADAFTQWLRSTAGSARR